MNCLWLCGMFAIAFLWACIPAVQAKSTHMDSNQCAKGIVSRKGAAGAVSYMSQFHLSAKCTKVHLLQAQIILWAEILVEFSTLAWLKILKTLRTFAAALVNTLANNDTNKVACIRTPTTTQQQLHVLSLITGNPYCAYITTDICRITAGTLAFPIWSHLVQEMDNFTIWSLKMVWTYYQCHIINVTYNAVCWYKNGPVKTCLAFARLTSAEGSWTRTTCPSRPQSTWLVIVMPQWISWTFCREPPYSSAFAQCKSNASQCTVWSLFQSVFARHLSTGQGLYFLFMFQQYECYYLFE